MFNTSSSAKFLQHIIMQYCIPNYCHPSFMYVPPTSILHPSLLGLCILFQTQGSYNYNQWRSQPHSDARAHTFLYTASHTGYSY